MKNLSEHCNLNLLGGVSCLAFSKQTHPKTMKTLRNLLIFTLLSSSVALAGVIGKSEKGAPEIKAINVISFAEDGVLLIGDGQSGQVVAVETGDTKPVTGKFADTKNFALEIAGRLGVGASDVEIIDLAVNPASGKLYIAVRKQDDKTYLIVRLAPGGEIEHFGLSDVTFAAVPLPEGVNNITDVVWIDNRLLASARKNEEFASKIFSVDGPLDHGSGGSVYSAETFHIQHGRWETKAPMSVMIPYTENGKHYIVGAFACTPVVRYPIDDVQPGAKIKGESVIEFGSGNRPLDMFTYERGGKPSVLTNAKRFHHERAPYGPSPHVAFRFDEKLLGTDKVNEKGQHRMKDAAALGDVIELVEPFHGVVQMDKLNDSTAIALREGKDEGQLDLVMIALP
ncbi:MAG: hypothetical protein ACI8UO_003135 [Verrucomicrobiales bacterium]|jgi:hypothetical protein